MNFLPFIARFSYQELVLFGTILCLIGLVMLLFLYALSLRLLQNRRDYLYSLKQARWEKILFNYIAGDMETVSRSTMGLEQKDWLVFGEFCEQYLNDLSGEDYDAIIRLLYEVDFGELLMTAVVSSDEWETTYAAYLLGVMRYKEAEKELTRLINHSSPFLSLVVFEALQKIGITGSVETVIKNIANSDFINGSKVAEIIMRFGPSITPLLIRLLQDPSVLNRGKRLILDVLIMNNASESLPVVMDLASYTKSMEVEVGCIKALGSFGRGESMGYLVSRLSSSDWVIRSQAVKALGNVADPSIVPELVMRLQIDENYWVKMYSAETLRQFGDYGRRELERLSKQSGRDDVSSIIGYVLHES